MLRIVRPCEKNFIDTKGVSRVAHLMYERELSVFSGEQRADERSTAGSILQYLNVNVRSASLLHSLQTNSPINDNYSSVRNSFLGKQKNRTHQGVCIPIARGTVKAKKGDQKRGSRLEGNPGHD